jgi:hypothetical protein
VYLPHTTVCIRALTWGRGWAVRTGREREREREREDTHAVGS